MTDDPRRLAWLDLALRPLPARALVAWLRALGTPEAVVNAKPRELAAIAGDDAARRLLGPVDAERRRVAVEWLADPSHELVGWDDPGYPPALLTIADPPSALFMVGRRELLLRPAVAIVGSRHATPQGLDNARAIAGTLSKAGLTIVSGLALGIDGAAHEGALDGQGSTIAVVGTGLDRVYPARHRDLAHRIAAQGAIVSEFAPGTPPLPGNFPRRNRLISGLARGVLVVEATESSGSLITARLAAEQGRDVLAIPGSIHSPFSKGPHRLIREGAKLVETAQDVLVELGIAAEASGPGVTPAPSTASATPTQRALLDAIGGDPIEIDRLVSRTGLPAETIAATLVELEIAGRVATLPGGRWQRLR